jgi:hypothetical protein
MISPHLEPNLRYAFPLTTDSGWPLTVADAVGTDFLLSSGTGKTKLTRRFRGDKWIHV